MKFVRIQLASQTLQLFRGRSCLAEFPVSTAQMGPGELRDSGCTPTGRHRVRIKIGGDCPPNTVFVARRPTGEIYSPALAVRYPERDWILTRIIWLTGCEPGRNRGGCCDTLRRFIYIHGCPDGQPMGVPGSHGCIRMRNCDVISLFDQVDPGMSVDILA